MDAQAGEKDPCGQEYICFFAKTFVTYFHFGFVLVGDTTGDRQDRIETLQDDGVEHHFPQPGLDWEVQQVVSQLSDILPRVQRLHRLEHLNRVSRHHEGRRLRSAVEKVCDWRVGRRQQLGVEAELHQWRPQHLRSLELREICVARPRVQAEDDPGTDAAGTPLPLRGRCLGDPTETLN